MIKITLRPALFEKCVRMWTFLLESRCMIQHSTACVKDIHDLKILILWIRKMGLCSFGLIVTPLLCWNCKCMEEDSKKELQTLGPSNAFNSTQNDMQVQESFDSSMKKMEFLSVVLRNFIGIGQGVTCLLSRMVLEKQYLLFYRVAYGTVFMIAVELVVLVTSQSISRAKES